MKSKILIIVSGLIGTGKTTTARELAAKFGAVHLLSDVIRKEMFSKRTYSREETDLVYAELFRRAEAVLKNGNVVLDATFLFKKYREAAKRLAEKIGADFLMIETRCPEEIVKKRLAARINDASEAKFFHYLEQKNEFEPIEEPHLIVRTHLQ
jgi:predicted kinase